MSLKVRVDHLLLGIGAVVLVVGLLLTWRALRPDPEQAELDQGFDRMRSKAAANPKAKPRFIRPRGAFSGAQRPGQPDTRVGWVEESQQVGDPGELDPGEAIDTFQAVLAELTVAVEDGRRLTEIEQAELYNRATGSFTVLSAWADGTDPTDRALLDDAYAQMLGLMRELDLEPPNHNPDGSPIQR